MPSYIPICFLLIIFLFIFFSFLLRLFVHSLQSSFSFPIYKTKFFKVLVYHFQHMAYLRLVYIDFSLS